MVEQVFKLYVGDEKTVEKVLFDENVHYLHIVFNNGDSAPEHYSNSTVYMTVVRGTLSIRLDDQPTHSYGPGTMLKIPFETKMNVGNQHDDPLELIIVKSPAPKA